MGATVSFAVEDFDAFMAHMNSAPESLAFMRATFDSDERAFRVVEVRLVDHDRRGGVGNVAHCELDEELQSEIIRWAWNEGGVIIEAHSHGNLLPTAQFSLFDLDQLNEWVPHVRWRLQGVPYVALVTASHEIDGLVWIDNEPEPLDHVAIDGREPVVATRASIERIYRVGHRPIQ